MTGSRRRRVQRWYVACTGATRPRSSDGQVGRRRPVGTAHAKQAGAAHTACGERTDSWVKLLEISFPTGGVDCIACAEIVHRALVDGAWGPVRAT